jgi:glucuronate isomerase
VVARLHAQGIGGMRVAAEAFEAHGKEAVAALEALPARGLTAWQADAALSHLLFEALGTAGMFAQLFLGIERDVSPRTSMAVDDPRRITDLYPLFERYPCGFELVIGAPGNNMDAAQAARIYPNVHLGGLWWYNFRASTYRQAMQVRAEAVPASKCALVASDARCIEWCYGKTLLVKWLLADVLREQVRGGWLSQDEALWLAREWLHDAPARRYEPHVARAADPPKPGN